jgi:hypothetical protein
MLLMMRTLPVFLRVTVCLLLLIVVIYIEVYAVCLHCAFNVVGYYFDVNCIYVVTYSDYLRFVIADCCCDMIVVVLLQYNAIVGCCW